ncbi:PD-(D/E)XK nuclease family protein [Candidatus Agathobaculum pullicola]|uniref:PD-(D/E)XK nuclease family protein n=1 Tax=Candidatus Agathobaculum pullicola TaxID=2838426 RepID=UPI003F8F1515
MNVEAKLAAIFPMLTESDLPIEELDIEVASRNSLRRSGVHTVAQLLQLTHTELVGLFPNRNLPFYSEIIYKLTCLAQPPNTAKTDDTCTVENLLDDFGEGCKMKTFNIFQVAGIWKSEEIHTRVIAELLNPSSRFHAMGTTFLEKFLDMLGLDEDLSKAKEMAKAQDTKDENMIKVKTEVPTDNVRRIDMVISTPNYYLPFEVKIWAGDQKNQLYDYYCYACEEARKLGKKVPYIYYLTPNGHNPSDWSLGSADDKLPVCTLSFRKDILPWLEECIKNTDAQSHIDLVEIMKQLRDNIRGEHHNMSFSHWGPEDILDDIYQALAEHYDLTWTECTDQYMTFTLHKKGDLEFALRIQKEGENSVSLHLLYGITQEGKPNYALTVPHIRENPQEYEVLLSNTFANRENVFDSTVASKWDRMKVIHCKKQDGTCIEKIEEVFSWLKDGIREK